MMPKLKPITVENKTYRSLRSACKEYGLHHSHTSKLLRQGLTIDEVFKLIPKTKDCAVCGKTFDYLHPQKIYCSGRCSKAASFARDPERSRNYQSKRYLSKKKQRHCKYCGEAMPIETRARKYCNKDCKAAARRSTPEGKAMVFVRSALIRIPPNARNKSIRSIEHTGKSAQELTAYIESLWSEGMSWDNFGRGAGTWQIDHIMPIKCKEVDLLNKKHQLAIMNYKNLQPLWYEENKAKSNKVTAAARRLFFSLLGSIV